MLALLRGAGGTLCGAGRNISQHEPFAAPRQSHSDGEDPVPAPQLVQINGTALTSAQTPPWDEEASGKGTLKKALLPSPFPFTHLLPQVKTNPAFAGQGRSRLVSAEVPIELVLVGHPRASASRRGRSCRVALPQPEPVHVRHLLMLRAWGRGEGRHNWWKTVKWLSGSHRVNSVLERGYVQKATSVFLMLLSPDPRNSHRPFL